MTSGKKGTKRQGGITVRIRRETKSRLDKIRHPGQSYDGLFEELLDAWDENIRAGRQHRLSVEEPAEAPDKRAENEWWWAPERGGKETPGKPNTRTDASRETPAIETKNSRKGPRISGGDAGNRQK